MSELPTSPSAELRKERFIVLPANDCVLRDCATGMNYHLQDKEEARDLAATFNIQYSHLSDLEVKFSTASTENAELRNQVTSLEEDLNILTGDRNG